MIPRKPLLSCESEAKALAKDHLEAPIIKGNKCESSQMLNGYVSMCVDLE